MVELAEHLEVTATGAEFSHFDGLRPLIFSGAASEGPAYRIERARGTDNWLLIITLAGCGRAGDRPVPEGSSVLWRPRTPHDYGAAIGGGGWKNLWAHFLPRPHWGPLLARPEAVSIAPYAERGKIEARFADLHRTIEEGGPYAEFLAMAALEEILVHCRGDAEPLRPRADDRIDRAKSLIHRDFARPLTVAGLASAVALSKSRFAHLFTERVGVGPRSYLEGIRMDHARRMLEHTSLPVGDIARAVGFEDPFYFSSRFRATTGTSPRGYRQILDGRSQNLER